MHAVSTSAALLMLPDHMRGRYVGTYWWTGWGHPVMLHVAAALQETFPFIQPFHLRMAWAYAYSNTPQTSFWGEPQPNRNDGIWIHADEAKVNFNMWVTPDEAREGSSEEGGLVVWLKKPPKAWTFDDYNHRGYRRDETRVTDFLGDTKPLVVAYKQNRAVVFDSDFLHRTEVSTFKPGHANRRINLTFLFGNMERHVPDATRNMERRVPDAARNMERHVPDATQSDTAPGDCKEM